MSIFIYYNLKCITLKKLTRDGFFLLTFFVIHREVLKDFDNADTISINTLAMEEMLLEEREQEMKGLHAINKKVSYLHTSLLYYRNPSSKKGAACYDAWRMLVNRVGGTPNTWRDLGCLLGLSPPDLDVR